MKKVTVITKDRTPDPKVKVSIEKQSSKPVSRAIKSKTTATAKSGGKMGKCKNGCK